MLKNLYVIRAHKLFPYYLADWATLIEATNVAMTALFFEGRTIWSSASEWMARVSAMVAALSAKNIYQGNGKGGKGGNLM